MLLKAYVRLRLIVYAYTVSEGGISRPTSFLSFGAEGAWDSVPGKHACMYDAEPNKAAQQLKEETILKLFTQNGNASLWNICASIASVEFFKSMHHSH